MPHGGFVSGRLNYEHATHCQRGHELTGYVDKLGRRLCVVCRRERDKLRRRRLRAARLRQAKDALLARNELLQDLPMREVRGSYRYKPTTKLPPMTGDHE